MRFRIVKAGDFLATGSAWYDPGPGVSCTLSSRLGEKEYEMAFFFVSEDS
jgi:hypothetical protein